ncbi:MAG: hypothetical protein HYZ29_31455 [Myxococcales bacterium]|nr:hypothetical protein [Myxococcales bacterium]
MTKTIWLASAVALAAVAGCGGDDDGGGSGGSGTGGSSTGGTGGSSTGGTAGSGGGTAGSGGGTAGSGGSTGGSGGSTGGTGGSTGGTGGSTGGTGGTGGGTGGTGGGSGFWPNAYNANCTPSKDSPSTHSGFTGMECINCHKAGGAAAGKNWLFGGVVFEAGGTNGAAKVEIGVKDGSTFHYACTDGKGVFFVDAAGTTAPNWATAEIRMRSATGDKPMNTKSAQAATCNSSSCHVALKLIKP